MTSPTPRAGAPDDSIIVPMSENGTHAGLVLQQNITALIGGRGVRSADTNVGFGYGLEYSRVMAPSGLGVEASFFASRHTNFNLFSSSSSVDLDVLEVSVGGRYPLPHVGEV